MKTSESIKNIAPLLLQAQEAMGDVKKGSDNPFFKSTYADLNAIREASVPVLNSLGIVVLQPTVVVDGKNYVETMLLHTSGEFVSSQTAIINDKGTAQAEGSGLSYARRYGLQALLNIGAVDDDAEGATNRGKNSFSKKLDQIVTKIDPNSNDIDPKLVAETINAARKSTFRKPAPALAQSVVVPSIPVKVEETDSEGEWV